MPELIEAAGRLIGQPFFLSQVDGRDPLAGGGHQQLHRDLCAERPGDTAIALAYLDDYGPHNGATRIVPGSHRPEPGAPPFDFADESRSVQLTGTAGDILVFDADLVHAASHNPSGSPRRTLLISYWDEALHAQHLTTAALRAVRLTPAPRFLPPA